MLEEMTPSHPLLEAFYGPICQDLGLQAEGTVEHKALVLSLLASSSCFTKKGPRVALRRWFSWFGAHHWHRVHWHARVLVLTHIGLQMGLYRDIASVPFFRCTYKLGAPREGAEVQGGAEEDPRSMLAVVPAEPDPNRPGSSTDPPPARKAVSGQDELSDLYKRCKNSMFVAASILSREGLRARCDIIFQVGKPFFDAHSLSAREMRGPEATREHYVTAAQGAFLQVCFACTQMLCNPAALLALGFLLSCSPLPQGPDDPRVLEQDEMAKVAMMFALQCIKQRLGSLSWHTDCWPGKLALACSPKPEERHLCLTELKADHKAFLAAKDRSKGDSFLQKLVSYSPFQTAVVRELAEHVSSGVSGTDSEEEAWLSKQGLEVFGGLGNTKLVEDLFQKIRGHEMQGCPSKVLKLGRMYALAVGSDVLASHNRKEVPPLKAAAAGKKPTVSAKDAMFPQRHQLQVDYSSLVGRRNWPSLAPKYVPVQSAMRSLLRECDSTGSWAAAENCWQSVLVPLGTVFQVEGQPGWRISLGDVVACGLLTWPLDCHELGEQSFYTLTESAPKALSWEHCLDLDRLQVAPCQVVSPIHARLLGQGVLQHCGPVFWQVRVPEGVVQNAARHCFWKLGGAILDKVCQSQGLFEKYPTDFAKVKALLGKVLPDLVVAEIMDILSMRGCPGEELGSADVPVEALDDLVDPKDKKDMQDRQMC